MKKIILVICLLIVGLLFWRLRFVNDAIMVNNESSKRPEISDKRTETLEPVRQSPGLVTLANRPIEFYGVVLDQNGNPISGVKIAVQIRSTKEPLPGTIGDVFEEANTVSDSTGRFSFTGYKGSVLIIKDVGKQGYQASPNVVNRSYRYWDSEEARFRPDVTRPEIFRMWKNAGVEPLIRKGISSPLHYDGTPSTFDLIEGKLSANGDLRVALVRNPQQIVRGQRNYEWTLTMEALTGGLTESNDEQAFRAPESGYQSKLVIYMPAASQEWTDTKTFNIYLRLRDGHIYGRAEIKILVGSERSTTPFYITSYLNPSGSRNLEYDAMQDIIGAPVRK